MNEIIENENILIKDMIYEISGFWHMVNSEIIIGGKIIRN